MSLWPERSLLIFFALCYAFDRNGISAKLSKSTNSGSRNFVLPNGSPAGDTINSRTCGENGPILLADPFLLTKLAHFHRERVLERRMVTNGNGAFGFFMCTNPSAKKLSKAKVFSNVGKITPLVARFGSEESRHGTPETVRTTQSFAVKLYTEEGNWDILSLNKRCFDIRDPARFSDMVHAYERDPKNNLINATMKYDYISSTPETLCAYMEHKADHGLPLNWRVMTTWAINAFKLINAKNEFRYARFILKAHEKLDFWEDDQAVFVRGSFPDLNSRDLVTAINEGNFPKWDLIAQILDPGKVDSLDFNPFDASKIWKEEQFPVIKLGEVVLNKNLDNFFAENELLAFSPSNIPPGIGLTIDKLLQGRTFAYQDAQNYRLGVNAQIFPINQPRISVHIPTLRDGYCPSHKNGGIEPNYYPNLVAGTLDSLGDTEQPLVLSNVTAKRYNTLDSDNYSSPKHTWNTMSKEHRQRVVKRIASELIEVESKLVVARFLEELGKVDPSLQSHVKRALAKEQKKDFRNIKFPQ